MALAVLSGKGQCQVICDKMDIRTVSVLMNSLLKGKLLLS